MCRPYRACGYLKSLFFPGRCPGLICCGPFGASTPCGARFCRMNRIYSKVEVPPGVLLPVAVGVGDDLVHQLGVVSHAT
jgi:hypothetical protein